MRFVLAGCINIFKGVLVQRKEETILVGSGNHLNGMKNGFLSVSSEGGACLLLNWLGFSVRTSRVDY
jgi:hypothetical protein